jgi:hypothetical protein
MSEEAKREAREAIEYERRMPKKVAGSKRRPSGKNSFMR